MRREITLSDEDRKLLAGAKNVEEAKQCWQIIEDRYLSKYGADVAALRKAAETVIEDLELSDYKKYMETTNKNNEVFDDLLQQEINLETDPERREALKASLGAWIEVRPCYEDAYSFMEDEIEMYIERIARIAPHDDRAAGYIARLIDKKASGWYSRPARMEYMPMIKTRPTTALGLIDKFHKEREDTAAGVSIYSVSAVEIVLNKFKREADGLNINADKLLCLALVGFTRGDHSENSPNETIKFSFLDYARAVGYNVDDADPKAAKMARDNARRAINKDLKKLASMSLSFDWKADIKYAKKGFDINTRNLSPIEIADIENGEICIRFTNTMAKYLRLSTLIVQYPTRLIEIDARDPNPYKIGKKLLDHYTQKNNISTGTYNYIGVKSLLKVSEIPTYEDVKNGSSRNWRRQILQPFMNALSQLVEIGLIETYTYCYPGRKPVPKELLTEDGQLTPEAVDRKYNVFEGMYILFEPVVKWEQIDSLAEKKLLPQN